MLRLDGFDPIVVSEKAVRRIMREGNVRPVYLKRPKLCLVKSVFRVGMVTFCWTSLFEWSFATIACAFRRRARDRCVCP